MKNEFDNFAQNYSAGMNQPIKKILTKTVDDFFNLKVDWLLNYLTRSPLTSPMLQGSIKFLDFGCGIGSFLKALEQYDLVWEMAGCDVSKEMLKWAKDILGDKYLSKLFRLDNNSTGLPESYYDLIVVNSVFHHIPPTKRGKIFQKLHSALKPGGYLIIFEHNPANPLVKLIVSRTDIDKNAVLVHPQEIINNFKTNDFDFISLDYIIFFPPRFRNKLLIMVEKNFSFLPWGGGYATVGKKIK